MGEQVGATDTRRAIPRNPTNKVVRKKELSKNRGVRYRCRQQRCSAMTFLRILQIPSRKETATITVYIRQVRKLRKRLKRKYKRKSDWRKRSYRNRSATIMKT